MTLDNDVCHYRAKTGLSRVAILLCFVVCYKQGRRSSSRARGLTLGGRALALIVTS